MINEKKISIKKNENKEWKIKNKRKKGVLLWKIASKYSEKVKLRKNNKYKSHKKGKEFLRN